MDISLAPQIDRFQRLLYQRATQEDLLLYTARYQAIVDDLLLRSRLPLRGVEVARHVNELFPMISHVDQRIWTARLALLAAPDLVLPLGYDEVRYSDELPQESNLSQSATSEEEWAKDLVAQLLDPDTNPAYINSILAGPLLEATEELRLDPSRKENFASVAESFIRVALGGPQYRTPDGAWHTCAYIIDKLVPFVEDTYEGGRMAVEEWVEGLCKNWLAGLEAGSNAPSALISLPALWFPARHTEDPLVNQSVRQLLSQLFKQDKSLHDLHWRDLEELVAELLRALGLNVSVTKRSWDGGRDVIARGELIPGEPTVMAVEVKHSAVVSVSKLRAALWANRHFPALLFATSGRFSAGVFKEKAREDNALRLYLKDGVGLGQWIDAYARRKGWNRLRIP